MKLFILLLALSFAPRALAEQIPWSRIVLSGGVHTLIGFAPPELRRTDVLNIFIEGDGKPGVGLELAQSVGGNSVYIARPCQYLVGNRLNSCSKSLWTSHRYSEAVIRSMNRAITAMKLRYQAQEIRLIGFSGGGAIATIVAAVRDDVELLVTVAGNLDHKRWTDFNETDPLDGSLNPVDFSKALETVPQVHLIGERDDVVPGSVLTSYLAHMTRLDNVQSYILVGADHTCCWSLALADLLQ